MKYARLVSGEVTCDGDTATGLATAVFVGVEGMFAHVGEIGLNDSGRDGSADRNGIEDHCESCIQVLVQGINMYAEFASAA